MRTPTKVVTLAVILVLVVLFWTWSYAGAQGLCGPAHEVVSAVTGPKYRERFVADMTIGDVPVRLYVNGTTGTWTVVTFTRRGACVALAGGGFRLVASPTSDEM